MHECIIYVMTENLEVKVCGDGLILITEAEVEPYTLHIYAYYPAWGRDSELPFFYSDAALFCCSVWSWSV